MNLEIHHRTAECPHCRKDSWQDEMYSQLFPVIGMWCNTKFKNGKIIKIGRKL